MMDTYEILGPFSDELRIAWDTYTETNDSMGLLCEHFKEIRKLYMEWDYPIMTEYINSKHKLEEIIVEDPLELPRSLMTTLANSTGVLKSIDLRWIYFLPPASSFKGVFVANPGFETLRLVHQNKGYFHGAPKNEKEPIFEYDVNAFALYFAKILKSMDGLKSVKMIELKAYHLAMVGIGRI